MLQSAVFLAQLVDLSLRLRTIQSDTADQRGGGVVVSYGEAGDQITMLSLLTEEFHHLGMPALFDHVLAGKFELCSQLCRPDLVKCFALPVLFVHERLNAGLVQLEVSALEIPDPCETGQVVHERRELGAAL